MKRGKGLVFVGVFVVSMMFLQLAYAAEPTLEFGGYVRVDMTGESISNGSDVMVFSPGDKALLTFTGRIENDAGLYAEAYGEGEFSLEDVYAV